MPAGCHTSRTYLVRVQALLPVGVGELAGVCGAHGVDFWHGLERMHLHVAAGLVVAEHSEHPNVGPAVEYHRTRVQLDLL